MRRTLFNLFIYLFTYLFTYLYIRGLFIWMTRAGETPPPIPPWVRPNLIPSASFHYKRKAKNCYLFGRLFFLNSSGDKSWVRPWGEHLCWGLFLNKVASSSYRDSGTGTLLWLLRNLKRTNFINVYKRLLLKSKIFVGVSFPKTSGFYYKQNRQLLYYEGAGRYVFLKIRNVLNDVFHKILLSGCFLKTSKSTKKSTSQLMLFRSLCH